MSEALPTNEHHRGKRRSLVLKPLGREAFCLVRPCPRFAFSTYEHLSSYNEQPVYPMKAASVRAKPTGTRNWVPGPEVQHCIRE